MKFKWIPYLRIHLDLEPAQSSLSLRLSLDMFHWSRPSCKNLSTCHHSQANQPITGSTSITGTSHLWLHFGPTRFQFSTIEPTCRTSRTPSPSPSPAGCCGTRAAASQCDEGQAAEGLRSEGTSRPNLQQSQPNCREAGKWLSPWHVSHEKDPFWALCLCLNFTDWFTGIPKNGSWVRTPIISHTTAIRPKEPGFYQCSFEIYCTKKSLSIGYTLQHWDKNTGGTHQVKTSQSTDSSMWSKKKKKRPFKHSKGL